MVWEAIIPAAAGLIGGLISKSGQDNTNATNVDLSRENRDFMERMSGTAYQRATADMMAAGLNPMLAYAQGGASTPTSAAPVVQNSLGAGVQGFASSAQQAIGVISGAQQVAQSKAQEDALRAQADRTRSETVSNDLNSARVAADIASARATADKTQQQILGEIADSAMKHARFQSFNSAGAFDFEASRVKSESERAATESQLSKYELAPAKASSDYSQGIGKLAPYLQGTLDLLRGGHTASRMLLGR